MLDAGSHDNRRSIASSSYEKMRHYQCTSKCVKSEIVQAAIIVVIAVTFIPSLQLCMGQICIVCVASS